MQSALASVEGVEGVEIDYGASCAIVTCSSAPNTAALIGALEGTKFTASVPGE
ncbi:MAG: heavy metal-associated domain-containing protein [Planctomycetota bacterium]|nr:heavy metal-associated domain-containing protein [Planctomycetota bacterium]